MSEYLNVTDALTYSNYKNIFSLRNPSGLSNVEPGPTRIKIELPEDYIKGDTPEDIDERGNIRIVKVPFSEVGQHAVSMCIEVTTRDDFKIAEKAYSDNLIMPDGIVPIGGDIVVPDQEQISLIDQVRKNTERLMLNKLGLRNNQYIESSSYDLFAKDEACEDIVVGVSVKTRQSYPELIRSIANSRVEADLSPDRIVVVNEKEVAMMREEKNKRSMGAFGLLKAGHLKDIVSRYI